MTVRLSVRYVRVCVRVCLSVQAGVPASLLVYLSVCPDFPKQA